jgi:UDP-N-acetylglucosamine 2-epimerase (non-hydrolysing)
MLDQVLRLFEIVPDYDLNIMKPGQDLYDITKHVLTGIQNVIKDTNPDLILVHGDTTTSMASALAAFYQQVPVGHVEAGLRTNNIYSPWPEEMNRQLTTRMTSLHFSPTALSRENLLKENVPDERIFVVGNTVIDALHIVLDKIGRQKTMEDELWSVFNQYGISSSLFKQWSKERKLILATGHRRENFGKGFYDICNAVKILAGDNPDVDIVYPMHLNPNVRRPIVEVFGTNYREKFNNLYFIEPLDYLPFVYLMNHACLIVTDSGGIQEEAPGLGKPVLVMRNTTERPEAIEAGTVRLVGTDIKCIVDNVTLLLTNDNAYNKMSKATNPYGDGKSSKRIVEILKIRL